MAQYIDKDAFVAEIESKIEKYTKRGEESDAKRDGYGMYWGGVLSCLNEVRTLCDSLEVKEVDFEETNADFEIACENILPKLIKKSEGNKIKKVLIDYFNLYKEQEKFGIRSFYGIPTDNILAWLEKHEENKRNLGGISSNWSEEDECYMAECISAIATKDSWSFEEKRKTKHWIKTLKGRVGCEANCTTTKEYVRKEDLIERACEWLRTHSEYDYLELIKPYNYCGACNLNKKKMIEDFKKHMEN